MRPQRTTLALWFGIVLFALLVASWFVLNHYRVLYYNDAIEGSSTQTAAYWTIIHIQDLLFWPILIAASCVVCLALLNLAQWIVRAITERMKRGLIVLIAVGGAGLLAFTLAANYFPDWTWKTLETGRDIAARLLRHGTPQADLSKYAVPPLASLEMRQGSCPSLPEDILYTLVVPTPKDEHCAIRSGGPSKHFYGVAYPLRGWLGCIDGHDLPGVRIDALSSDGGTKSSSTVTNSTGRFLFPDLTPGTYHLAVNSIGLQQLDVVVTTSSQTQDSLCLMATGRAGSR